MKKPKEELWKVCQHCGKKFLSSYSKKKYCENKCLVAARYDAVRKNTKGARGLSYTWEDATKYNMQIATHQHFR